MAARLSRGLLQANCRRITGLPLRATPRVAIASASAGFLARRNVRNIAPWTSRVPQVNIARYAHTESGPSAEPQAAIPSVVEVKGNPITEKHWTSQELPVVDALIEPQTIHHFIEFLSSGVLPNGKKTDLALLNRDEIDLFMAPSAEWAPAPFNKGNLPAIYNMMSRILSPETNALCQVGFNIHAVKNRLWEGLVPLSAERWLEKDLNNPDHFAIAHEYLTSVIAVFEYLNVGPLRNKMRDSFNRMSDDLREMQDALNARRKAQTPPLPEIDLPALWVEFIHAKYEVMTSTSHFWVMARVAEMRERLVNDLMTLSPDDTNSPDFKKFTERWQALIGVASMADLNIWMFMEGYKGYQAPSEVVGGLHQPDLKNYDINSELNNLMWERLRERIEAQDEAAKVQGPDVKNLESARRERISVTTEVQDELRTKIRGASPPQPPSAVPWIQLVLRAQQSILRQPASERPRYGFGLAIYRSAYDMSDEQWDTLRRDVEAHLSAWGNGVPGADEVKPLLKLHWFECKDLGVDTKDPQAVVEAAKRHFQGIRSSDEYGRKIDGSAFLLVDPWTAGSYTNKDAASLNNEPGNLPGDFQPYVVAVDADFAPRATSETETDKESTKADTDADADADANKKPPPPEYKGHVRIQGNLVWSELYPLLSSKSAELEHLWPLAREHPERVYTGLTVPSQVAPWQQHNSLKRFMTEGFTDYLKKKDPKAAEALERMRKSGITSL